MTREEFEVYVRQLPNGRPELGLWTGWTVEGLVDGTLSAVNTYIVEERGQRFVAMANISEGDLLRYLDGDLDRPIVLLLDERRQIAESLAVDARSKVKRIILP